MWQFCLEKEAELKLSRGSFNFDRPLEMFLASKLVTGGGEICCTRPLGDVAKSFRLPCVLKGF